MGLRAIYRAACVAVVTLCPSPAVAQPGWAVVWESAISVLDVPSVTGRTVRQFARVSASGSALKITLSNSTGTAPALLSDVHVALAGDAAGSIRVESDRAVTFGGSGSVEIPPGADVVSDPIPLPVAALTRLAVSAYVVTSSTVQVGHFVASEANVTIGGDHSGEATLPGGQTTTSGFYLSSIGVYRSQDATGAIVALGDSLTDGYLSSVGSEHRWPDRLAERLLRQVGGAPSVSNAGLWGNGLLQGNPDGVGGISALARLQRDVLSRADVRWIVLFEGINDVIYHSAEPGTVAALIADYGQIIAQAHDHGVKVYVATLTPFNGPGTSIWTPAREALRTRLNAWIRGTAPSDGVLDFDAAVRRPGDPTMLRPDFDGGDHLHLSDSGYRALGDAVPLDLFR